MVPQVRPKGIRLRTEYTAENDFIAAFHDFCEDTTLFVPTDKLYPTGTHCYFSIELADEAPMLRGLGVVIVSWDDDRNQFGCAGVHVEITQLTTASEDVFDKLLAARPARGTTGRHRKAPLTQQQWGAVIEASTIEMEAVEPIEESPPPPPPRAITRDYPSSVPPMTAAPVAPLDDRAMGTTRYDVSLRPPAPIPTPSMPDIPVPARETPTPAASRAASQGLMRPWWQERRIIGVFAVGILVGLVMHAALRPPAPPSGEPATGVAVANAAATSCETVATAQPTTKAAAAMPAPVASIGDVTVKKPALAKPAAKPSAPAIAAAKPAPTRIAPNGNPTDSASLMEPGRFAPPRPAPAARPAAKPTPAIATAKPAPAAAIATTKPAPAAAKPAATIATTKPAPAAAKPGAAKPAAAIATTKPAPPAAKPAATIAGAKPAPAAAKPAAAKPAPTIATAKPAPAAAKPAATIATTKPAPIATAKPAPAKPGTAAKPTATTKAAVARVPAKRKCTSLDCI